MNGFAFCDAESEELAVIHFRLHKGQIQYPQPIHRRFGTQGVTSPRLTGVMD